MVSSVIEVYFGESGENSYSGLTIDKAYFHSYLKDRINKWFFDVEGSKELADEFGSVASTWVRN